MSIMLLRHVLHVLPGFLYIVLLLHIFVCEHVFICMHWFQNVSCMCARDCDCVFALCVCVYVCVHTCISMCMVVIVCICMCACVCCMIVKQLWSPVYPVLFVPFSGGHMIWICDQISGIGYTSKTYLKWQTIQLAIHSIDRW